MYQKMISYMYEYVNGEKGNNIGFAKIAVQNQRYKIKVHIKNFALNGRVLNVYGFVRGDSILYSSCLGSIKMINGIGEGIFAGNTGELWEKYRFLDMSGLILCGASLMGAQENNGEIDEKVALLKQEKARFCATQWEEGTIVLEQLDIFQNKKGKGVLEAEHGRKALQAAGTYTQYQPDVRGRERLRAAENVFRYQERISNTRGDSQAVSACEEFLGTEKKSVTQEFVRKDATEEQWKNSVSNNSTEYMGNRIEKEAASGWGEANLKQERKVAYETGTPNVEQKVAYGLGLANSEVEDAVAYKAEKPNVEQTRELAYEIGKPTVEQGRQLAYETGKPNVEQASQIAYGTEKSNVEQAGAVAYETGKSNTERERETTPASEMLNMDLERKAAYALDRTISNKENISIANEKIEEKDSACISNDNKQNAYSSNCVTTEQKVLQNTEQQTIKEATNQALEAEQESFAQNQQKNKEEDIWDLFEQRRKQIQLQFEEIKHGTRGETKAETENTTEGETKWQPGEDILEKYPEMCPFFDNFVLASVRVEPKDIGVLPMEYWYLANNSFLLHGYYCYRHLLFMKMEIGQELVYAIAVPGNSNYREKFMANMFGFEQFKTVQKKENAGFGYWWKRIF